MYVEILRKLFRLISLDFLLSADSNITDLATPKDTVYMLKIWDSRSEGGMEKWISKFRRTKAVISQNGPQDILFRTNRCQNQSPWMTLFQNTCVFWSPPWKLEWNRPILSAKKNADDIRFTRNADIRGNSLESARSKLQCDRPNRKHGFLWGFRRYTFSEMRPMLLYTLSQKTTQLWNDISLNCVDRFWWYLAEIFKRL